MCHFNERGGKSRNIWLFRPVRVRCSVPVGVFVAATGAGQHAVAECCSAEALQTPPGPAC